MIVYRELSSLAADLGVTSRTLYSLSNSIDRHYHNVEIPKANGGTRVLSVPDDILKIVQKGIERKLFSLEPVSPYCTAYRPWGSTLKNARPHIGKPVVLKLDIKSFFDSVTYALVKEKAFPESRYSEQNRILLTILCMYDDGLPQGAPTSPAISNIIMREFDDLVGSWCRERKIAYTRYCDDMTFSGDFDPAPVIRLVRSELREMGLFLNDRKTTILHDGQRKSVTGIVVNEKASVSSDYRRELRKEMHFCMKYGVASHMERTGMTGQTTGEYAASLLGRVNYVLSVDPENNEMREYKRWLKGKL